MKYFVQFGGMSEVGAHKWIIHLIVALWILSARIEESNAWRMGIFHVEIRWNFIIHFEIIHREVEIKTSRSDFIAMEYIEWLRLLFIDQYFIIMFDFDEKVLCFMSKRRNIWIIYGILILWAKRSVYTFVQCRNLIEHKLYFKINWKIGKIHTAIEAGGTLNMVKVHENQPRWLQFRRKQSW